MPKTRILQRAGVEADILDLPVQCPAGVKMDTNGVPGVFCRIEESVIDAATNPSSLAKFCMGGYARCSSWRADKENTWRARNLLSQNFAKRPGNTLVDQALRGEDVPSFSVPRSE